MSAADIEAARHLLGPNVRWVNLVAAPVIGLAFAAIPLARVYRATRDFGPKAPDWPDAPVGSCRFPRPRVGRDERASHP